VSLVRTNIFYRNAMAFLAQERRSSKRINAAYKTLLEHERTPAEPTEVRAGAVEWLANPFVRTALSILQSLSGNYKIREAIKLLKEAGAEAEAEEEKKKKAKPKKKWSL